MAMWRNYPIKKNKKNPPNFEQASTGGVMVKKSKYNNKKVEIDGILYDSLKEGRFHQQLLFMERQGDISNLRQQVKYVLIPTQRAADVITKTGKRKPGPVIERECSYYADFVYTDADGKEHVIDTKGFRTKEYIIKRKLMLHVYNIQIEEV